MVEIICEIGQNHGGDLEVAKDLIRAAKENGANVVKFQLFDTDKIFSPTDLWYNYSKKAQLSYLQTLDLSVYCNRLGIEFMASVFDS
jgi:sialic acid synthase SpsE